jgi:adenine-specific DNA-methyltransferase
VAFENHLNYYHCNGAGLPARLAKGLAAFLNSTIVDRHFRQWSGHTQVNASDLRTLRYPAREVLEDLGKCIGTAMPPQDEVDALVLDRVFRRPGC